MEDNHLFEKLQSQSLTCVYDALIYIRTKYLKQPNGVKRFYLKGGIKILISLIEKPKLSDIGLSILANCCLDNEVRKQVLKYNGITSLIRILRCLASESVQNRACRALSNLAIDKFCAKVIHEQKAISIIVKFLQLTKDPNCQHTAIRALRILGDTEEHRTDIIHNEGILAVAELFNSEDNILQKQSLKTIAWLTQHCSNIECAQQIQEVHGLKILVTLSSHSDNDIREYALTCLVNLSALPAIRPELGISGAIPLFVNKIENNQNEKPGLIALSTALCLCCQDSLNRIRIRKSGGLKLLLNLLNEVEHEILHERIIISLLAFRFDEQSLNILIDIDFISILIKQLNIYINNNKKDHVLIADNYKNQIDIDTVKNNELQDLSISIMNKQLMRTEFNIDIDFNFSQSNSQNSSPLNKTEAETIEMTPLTKEIESTDDGNDNDANNELTSITLQKTNNSSKVFCIYSPSYQEIQNEQHEVIFNTDSVLDNHNWDICSPSSNSSFSPDRYSLDWSIPSPPSPYGMWSPATSSREENQWSPISAGSSVHMPTFSKKNIDFISLSSPSSPSSCSSPSHSPQPATEILRYSPVCEEHISEEENDPVTDDSVLTSVNKNTEMEEKEIYVSKQSTNDNSHSDNSPEKTVSSLSLAKQVKRRRTSLTSDISCHSSSLNDSKQNYNIGDYIILHLSHLSQMEKPASKIIAKESIQILLDYISFIPNSTARAERILLRLTANYFCFENLISFGIALLIQNKLDRQHKPELCDKCNHLKYFQDKLLKNLSLVAESGFGIGVICHMLLTGMNSEQHACILAVPYLVRRRNLLQRILIDCYGLETLTNLLKTTENQFQLCVNSLSTFCQHFLHLPPDISNKTFTNTISDKMNNQNICNYMSDIDYHDVTFILDDGSDISARRSQLTEESIFFNTLLQGCFAESTQTHIKLPEVSSNALNIVFHYLYKCKNICYKLTTAAINTLLELIPVTDRFLLKELEACVIKEIIVQISPESVCDIYLYSKKYSCGELFNIVLKYILIGNIESEERSHCISILSNVTEIIDDIEKFIRSKFTDLKDRPIYKKRSKSMETVF